MSIGKVSLDKLSAYAEKMEIGLLAAAGQVAMIPEIRGKAATGLGGPHVGIDMIWPLGVVVEGLTASDKKEVRNCIETLRKTHAGTGFMHEAFHKDNPEKFTRSWFAWANTIFGELLWKTFQKSPELLD